MRVSAFLGVADGYEALAPSTSTGFTTSKICPTSGTNIGRKAKAAVISVEDADIRFTLDGTAASTTVGHMLYKYGSYEIVGEKNIENFRCIDAVAGVASSVKCTFFF